MNWSDLGKLIGPLAPTIGTVLAGPAGGAAGAIVGNLLGAALGVEPTPDAISEAAQSSPDLTGEVIRKVEAEYGASIAEMEARMIDAINGTMREEMKHEDWIVRSWRPLFGITFNLVWTIHGLLIAWCMWQRDFTVISRIPDLTVFYGVAGAAVGIYAWRRTDEKKAGLAGPLAAFANAATSITKAVKR